MRDIIWFLFTGILFVFLSPVFIGLGLLIWKKQRMDLIIRYHCDKVTEENKRAYCVLAGSGVIIIGIGFFLSGIGIAWIRSAAAFVPMTAGLVCGITLLAAAGIKYNRRHLPAPSHNEQDALPDQPVGRHEQ